MHWTEKSVPDPEICMALFTMGFPQGNTTFVWFDSGILDMQGRPSYKLLRRVELPGSSGGIKAGVFAAYTAEEFMMVLPMNFIPMKMRDNTFSIMDLHGSRANESRSPGVNSTALIMARVNGSGAATLAQAFAQAAVFLVQTGAIKGGDAPAVPGEPSLLR